MDRSGLPLFNENKLKLGIFCMNVSYGASMTKAPGTLTPTWDENVRIAQAADRAGWEFLLPLGRWKGVGGEINPYDRSFEVYTWAAGIAAVTQQIQVFTTSHLRFVHPVMAAKQGATIDHISHGRSALNIVAGQRAEECEMFGIEQIGHDDMYGAAEEWTMLVKRLYTEENDFDFDGRYFRMKGARINPKPLQQPYPPIVNAGMSGAGRAFGAKHADFTFVNLADLDQLRTVIAEIRTTARTEHGREMGMLNHGYVVCRDTEKEALDYVKYFVDECGDWSATEAYVESYLKSGAQSLSPDALRAAQRGMIAGFNGVPYVGTPEHVVEKMVAISKAGIDGSALHWVDYEAGIEYFNQRVLPLMIQAGLRKR
jgi:FMNH2-dependent dimethyl sulfone monooxygenase